MNKNSRVLLAAGVAVGLSLTVLSGTANATPSEGVTAVTIFDNTVGSTEYVLKEITIAPGGSTGWHYHPGQVYAYVKEGVLSHNDANCASDGVYDAGQFPGEPQGRTLVRSPACSRGNDGPAAPQRAR